MGDGKALQMGTSHELGQNFAKAFDIDYLSAEGRQEHCWTTSWGSSTRMLGGLIMCHGDDNGLRVPPRLAPIQAQVTVVKDGDGVVDAAAKLRDALRDAGVRVEARRPGRHPVRPPGRRRRAQGVPGARRGRPARPGRGQRGAGAPDRRVEDARCRSTRWSTAVTAALEADQQALYDEALARREEHTVDVSTLDEAIEAAGDRLGPGAVGAVGVDGEAKANAAGVTVRCLIRADGSVPDSEDEPDLVAYLARSY